MKLPYRKTIKNVISLCLALVLLMGCVSYSTLQTPETLAPGDVSFGGGVSTFLGLGGLLPEFGGRIGVVDRFDIGLKYTYPNMISVDTKYQLIRRKINMATDVGVSFSPLGDFLGMGFYPAVLVGQKHWYAGIKGIFGNFSYFGDEIESTDSFYLGTNLITGTAIGKNKIKFLIELNTLFPNGSVAPIFIPACGFYFNF